MKKFFLMTLLAAASLVVVLAVNTVRQRSRQLDVAAVRPLPALDAVAAANRLGGALKFPTISHGNREVEGAPFDALHAYLQDVYPLAHQALIRERINRYSLLYTWQGTDPTAKPIMLMAHQDVVPVAPGTEVDWDVEPFSGTVRDGYVWGRGAWDNKGSLLAILEAVESLRARGFRPRQTIYLAFGHDEENGGETGAKAIARLLQSRGERLDFVLDEGLVITDEILPGVQSPLALVGTAEKGMLTLSLGVATEPGHASAPGRDSAIGTLSQALVRLENSPLRARIAGATGQMFDTLAPETTGLQRLVLSNRWLFGGLLMSQLERSPSTNAMIRTTTALTVVRAGNKENVLPGRAEALVNFRILPGDNTQRVLAHARGVVADEAISIDILGSSQEPSPVSSSRAQGFRVIEQTIRETHPGTLVAPALLIGATDSRHMASIADDIYRFSPVHARQEDLSRFHGTNERIAVSNYAAMIRFYARLITNASQSPQQDATDSR
ncbi:hypothetical protein ASD77_17465 [Pseudoxanthomonas sp. Root65]|uniref:M20 family peptidase n=1 Tax=Pseudoxanthomonas sp. Root65 TaxID=1736576 RepID=UPI0006F886AE|nr:M20 family peptidase [Pseudoxanthomonas sp. Root65]KRA50662.1 hypothetical protein ASD77_17465 [Pseudoxanthomonas sp. Root65]